MEDYQTFIGLFGTSAVYALILQLTHKKWQDGWTIVTVIIGVILVGLFVRWRISDPPSGLDGQALLTWQWWQWVYHFVAAGIPIGLWQLWQDRRKIKHALGYRRNGNDR